MNWGVELWDQFDNIGNHTNKGIEFCEKFLHFIRERCAIESEYASKLKRLVKSYQPKEKGDKKKDEEFTYITGFNNMLGEIFDFAGQREAVAEKLTNSVARDLQTCIQDTKQERKKFMSDGARQMTVYQNQMAQLEKSKRQFEKSCRELEKAQELLTKTEADDHVAKVEIEKSKQNVITKQQSCDDCKGEYAMEVGKMKEFQRDHFFVLMPHIFEQMQKADEQRINNIQTAICQSADIERQTLPIIAACIDGIQRAATVIVAQQDLLKVISLYKSGFAPPNDIEFEDLSRTSVAIQNAKMSVGNKIDTLRGGLKEKRRSGILGRLRGPKSDEVREDFGHLPPIQQEKHLRLKIEALKAEMTKEVAERDAVSKMQNVYRSNPKLGDAASLTKKLEESGQIIDRLHIELQKYEKYLVEASARDSVDLCPDAGALSVPGVPIVVYQSSPRADRGVTSKHDEHSHTRHSTAHHHSTRSTKAVSTFDDSFDDDVAEDDGSCVALYEFDGASEGTLSMKVGEQFAVVERDHGDGWTQVRNSRGEVGYIPTSYVECHFEV